MPSGVYVRKPEHNLAQSLKMSGRKSSEETRLKISRGNLGHAVSEETRRKISQSHIGLPGTNKGKFGELAPRWRGGITAKSRADRNRLKTDGWRIEVFRRDDYTCQTCSRHGGDLHADHVKPFSKFPELRFLVSNGRTLCRSCHYLVTFGKQMPKGSRWGLYNPRLRSKAEGL
jgi:hypothetical protein